MKTYVGVEVQLHAFLTSTLDEGEWSGSRSGRFTLRKSDLGSLCIGGWVGPRAGLDGVEKTPKDVVE
jgi:hypothetical protein